MPTRDWLRARTLSRMAVPFLVSLTVYGATLAVMRPVPNGDEPHYALEAYSLARDGDRDLSDDYLDAERLSWIYPWTLEPHAFRFRADGPMVSYHGVGVPLLLAPMAAVARGWLYLRIVMVVIAALAAAILFSILRTLAPRWRWRRWAIWAMAVFSWPVLSYSSALYPELPAALVVLIAVRALMAPRLTATRIVAATAAAAVLPFLHVRFLPVAVGLAVIVLVRAVISARGCRRELIGGLAACLLTLAVGAALFALCFEHWYGSPLPSAPLRSTFAIPGPNGSADFHPADSLRQPLVANLVPMFSSIRQGWLPYAPWGLVALAGTLVLVVRRNWWAAGGVLIAAAYLVLVAVSGAGIGASLPGRFSLIFLPLLAIGLVPAVRASRGLAALTWVLGGVSAVIAVGALTHWGGLYADLPGERPLGIASPLLAAWTPGAAPPAASAPRPHQRDLVPDLVAGPAGTVSCCGERSAGWSRSGASTGMIAMSQPRDLWHGEYTVVFSFAAVDAAGAPPGDLGAVRLDIGGRTYIDDRFDRRALPATGVGTFSPRFRTLGGVPVSAGVESLGRTKLWVGRPYFIEAAVVPPGPSVAPGPQRQAAPAPLERWRLWAILVVLLAAALLVAEGRRRRPGRRPLGPSALGAPRLGAAGCRALEPVDAEA